MDVPLGHRMGGCLIQLMCCISNVLLVLERF
jgi:hypothetical protein